jgi:hypothetical protein
VDPGPPPSGDRITSLMGKLLRCVQVVQCICRHPDASCGDVASGAGAWLLSLELREQAAAVLPAPCTACKTNALIAYHRMEPQELCWQSLSEAVQHALLRLCCVYA